MRFICPSCQQLLGISSRKIGAQVKCPKCRTALIVPHPDEAAPDALPEMASCDAAGDLPAMDEVWADLTAVEQAPAAPLAKSAGASFDSSLPADPDIVQLPRRMLYVQGILLAVVAIGAFVAGYFIGGAVHGTGP